VTTPRATIDLPHPPALEASELVAFLARRAVAGVETVRDGAYSRSLRLPHGAGVVTLRPRSDRVRVELDLEDPRDEPRALDAARHILRLDVDPDAVAERLGDDPVIGALVRAAPGRRVPGHHDPFELAVRAVLGQQVSVQAAATLAARLVDRCGDRLVDRGGDRLEPTVRGVTHLWPAPEWFARLDPEQLPMPRARGRALVALGGAGAADARLPGIGPWTLSYVALRTGDDDAFLPTDLGVRHGLEAVGQDPRAASEVAEGWRPYRALGVAHLWAAATPPRRPSPRATA
jgi:AraC family transcriptional regulator of adaptative response / DNA-3-methyladenine glycosylase II